jgi:hypothetical protein
MGKPLKVGGEKIWLNTLNNGELVS